MARRGFIAAGELFPVLVGRTWAEFVQERILTPAGMAETVTSVHLLDDGDNVAMPHKYGDGAWVPVEW